MFQEKMGADYEKWKKHKYCVSKRQTFWMLQLPLTLKDWRRQGKNLSLSQRDQNNIWEQNELFMSQYAYITTTTT